MLATKNESIEVAYIELQRLSQDKEKRMEYEDRQKAIRDHNHLINQFKQEGIKEGKQEEKMSIARNLIDILDVETIAIKTGLSIEEVLKIKEVLGLALQ